MSSYCTVADVCAPFPFFKRNQTGSISDAQIQTWIDLRKTRIRSALLTRGFDPDNPPNPPLTTDQANFLSALNADGAIADLGDALQSTNSLQSSEFSVSKEHRDTYERILMEIRGDPTKQIEPQHDYLFQSGPIGNVARRADVRPLFHGSSDTVDPSQIPQPSGRLFYKRQVF
jgi:hypothetical protein